MERKSCCCSGRSTYVATTPKKEENANPQILGSKEPTVLAAAGVTKPAKTEPKDTMTVNKQEQVKVEEANERLKMERKSCCCSGRTYVSTPKKEPAVVVGTPKKEENVKQEIAKKETNVQSAPGGVMKAAKTEEKDTVNVNKQEPVKVNVGAAGGSSFK